MANEELPNAEGTIPYAESSISYAPESEDEVKASGPAPEVEIRVDPPLQVSHKCHHNKVHSAANLARRTARYAQARASPFRELASVAATTTLYLNIQYVQIPMSAGDKIGVDKIRSNHDVINLHYGAYQQDASWANTKHYPYFTGFMGDPHIQFLPLDSSQANIDVTTFANPPAASSLNQNLQGYAEVADAETEYKNAGGTIKAGWVYVYITTITDPAIPGTILGLAGGIIANNLMVHPGTIGSPDNHGSLYNSNPLYNYGGGKTLVHELGHCFGLLHPFSGTCSDSDTLAQYAVGGVTIDAQPQKNPNYYATVTLALGGTDNAGDNRGNDYVSYTGASCESKSDLAADVKPWETFMIFMDYASDPNQIGFPSFHVTEMRSVLTSGHTDLFTVSTTADGSVSAAVSVSPSADSGAGLSGGAIAGIVVGAVVLLIIIALSISYSGRAASSAKRMHAYDHPFVRRQYV